MSLDTGSHWRSFILALLLAAGGGKRRFESLSWVTGAPPAGVPAPSAPHRWQLRSGGLRRGAQQVEAQQRQHQEDQHQDSQDLLDPQTSVELLLQPAVTGHHPHELVRQQSNKLKSGRPFCGTLVSLDPFICQGPGG